MCRHIGYIGKEKSLGEILLNHEHSLIELSYKPKEMENAILNADGFGIGWVRNKKFQMYKNTMPIWNDLNLKPLASSIFSSLVIGNVRSATITENIGHYNTHPFVYKNYCFSHNGYIEDFNFVTKKKISKHLNDKFLSQVKGNTDSELLFLLLMQYIEVKKDIEESIKKIIEIVEKNYSSAMLNFLLAVVEDNGNETLYATKFSKNINPPTLYYTEYKNNEFFISSEKLNNRNWVIIKNKSLIKIKNKSLNIFKL